MIRWKPANTVTGAPAGWEGDIPDGPAPPLANEKDGKLPFIMKPLGVGTIFGSGMGDGPFPEHYEPLESPVPANPMSKKHRVNPTIPIARLQAMAKDPSFLFSFDTERYPIVATTYRVSEHWQTGVMTRHLPWLLEMQPQMFVEMSLELAAEKGIKNGDTVSVTSARGELSGVAIVTDRFKSFKVMDTTIHQVGMPWCFGWQYPADGSGGDSANLLIPFMGDPNTLIPESKAFMVNIRKIAGQAGLRPSIERTRGGSHDRTKILFHRHDEVHGMPGVPGGLQAVESEPGNENAPAGDLPEPAGSFDGDLQAGEIQRAGPARQENRSGISSPTSAGTASTRPVKWRRMRRRRGRSSSMQRHGPSSLTRGEGIAGRLQGHPRDLPF